MNESFKNDPSLLCILMTPPASQHQCSQYNLTEINWMPILSKTAAASQWMSIRSEVVLVCILLCEFTGTCSYGIYQHILSQQKVHCIHAHTYTQILHAQNVKCDYLTFLPVSFQKVPPRLKLSCGWKKEKKERKTSSHTHPPRQYHPHTESDEGHVMKIVNINSFLSTWLCMHLMKHAPFI